MKQVANLPLPRFILKKAPSSPSLLGSDWGLNYDPQGDDGLAVHFSTLPIEIPEPVHMRFFLFNLTNPQIAPTVFNMCNSGLNTMSFSVCLINLGQLTKCILECEVYCAYRNVLIRNIKESYISKTNNRLYVPISLVIYCQKLQQNSTFPSGFVTVVL